MALDVGCTFCDLAVVTVKGRRTRRERVSTSIPALVEVLQSVSRPRYLTFEEGAMADWLARNLRGHVDELLVCDPRRNRLVCEESDKDDPLDAEKLAQLYRGGYLKEVYHPESEARMVLKHHVHMYHNRVQQRVREANRIVGTMRSQGVIVTESDFAAVEDRPALLRRLPRASLWRKDLELLLAGYDYWVGQEECLQQSVIRLARREEVVRRFAAVPGFAWIRGVTFFVYVDTPWRFSSKSALWKYLGIGLRRWHSGEGPTRVKVCRQGNRRLKWVILGAAMTAIQSQDNPFAAAYYRWRTQGVNDPNARRNVARSLATTLWGMWKNGNEYHPEWVGGNRPGMAAS